MNEITDLTTELITTLKGDDNKAIREVLIRYSPNLIWNEEKLSIINAKPFQVLIDGLAAAKRKNPQFAPENIVDTSSSNEDFSIVCPILLRTWDDVRLVIILKINLRDSEV